MSLGSSFVFMNLGGAAAEKREATPLEGKHAREKTSDSLSIVTVCGTFDEAPPQLQSTEAAVMEIRQAGGLLHVDLQQSHLSRSSSELYFQTPHESEGSSSSEEDAALDAMNRAGSAKNAAGQPLKDGPAPVAHSPPVNDEEEEEEDVDAFIDEFGFIVDEETKVKEEQDALQQDEKKKLRAVEKWEKIAQKWNEQREHNDGYIKRRCRKGIPSAFRGNAWQLMLRSRERMLQEASAGSYHALCAKPLPQIDDLIEKDLSRTFPTHVLFRAKSGLGQQTLARVLHAYAAMDADVGYVQGMAFVVSAMSTQMSEEESFWALYMLMHCSQWSLRDLYRSEFPLLHQLFYQLRRLLAKVLPVLHKRFESFGIHPSFYASQWWMTLFSGVLPFRVVLRVWDMFFNEGWKIMFRVAIALLKREELRLLSLPYEEVLLFLKAPIQVDDCERFIQEALSVKFKTALLLKYKAQYWEQKSEDNSVPV